MHATEGVCEIHLDINEDAYGQVSVPGETGITAPCTKLTKMMMGITGSLGAYRFRKGTIRAAHSTFSRTDISMTSTPKITNVFREPPDWVKRSVCDECCLPLSLYGFNDFHYTDGDRFVTKLYCDPHAEEFRIREDADRNPAATSPASDDD